MDIDKVNDVFDELDDSLKDMSGMVKDSSEMIKRFCNARTKSFPLDEVGKHEHEFPGELIDFNEEGIEDNGTR